MPKKQKSITYNFIMNTILTMSSFIFPLITFPYVSRVLQPLGNGKVAFATSMVSYFAMVAQLGIPTYGIRACAKVRDNRTELTKVTQELFMINMIMSMLSYSVFILVLFSVPRFQESRVLYLIISSTILFNVLGMGWLYQALEQYTYITIRSLIFKIVALVAMFVLVKRQEDYVIYGGISVFAASASNICNFVRSRSYVDWKLIKQYELKKHWKPIFVFFAMSCATTVYLNLDSVMLGFMNSDVDVGYYNVAVKVKTILTSLVASLGTVLLPRVSYYIEHHLKEEFLRITSKAMNFVIVLATPLMVYFMLFAREVIALLAGQAYAPSVVPMQIIMPTILFIGMTNIMGIQMLVPLGKEKQVLYSEIAGAFVNLILNSCLIPNWKSTGAAIGTLIAEIVVWIVQFYFLSDLIKRAYREICYWKIGIATIFGMILTFWIKYCNFGNFFTLLISCSIFAVIYLLTLFLLKESFVCGTIIRIKEYVIKKRQSS